MAKVSMTEVKAVKPKEVKTYSIDEVEQLLKGKLERGIRMKEQLELLGIKLEGEYELVPELGKYVDRGLGRLIKR